MSDQDQEEPTTAAAADLGAPRPPTIPAAADSRISAGDARTYWQGIDSDVNGMLGGYPSVSRVDLRGSRSFIAKLGLGRTKGVKAMRRAMEGGAGIGRITQGLLLDIAETVDIVEPIAKFTAPLRGQPGIGQIANVGLEEWRPDDDDDDDEGGVKHKYDLMWNQWCLGHLNDRQLHDYLVRSQAALSRHDDGGVRGIIVVKENMCTGGGDVFDDIDSSVTREDQSYRRIFDKAGLRIIKTELQHGFPQELYPVRMYALKPKEK
ncbi:alpha-N-methyltransferase NTM1 [Xylariomycetidae sp. FL2044]|nr:alpha-N-methyltransferase NTM1 [Xylariomycetidae sp. FL2044]